MPDESSQRPIESDETYTHDQQTATYQGRARTAAARYRNTTNPSNFRPAPAAPAADPEPAADPDGISPRESNKVNHYDGLTATHRTKTGTEVTRFGTELTVYAAYYNAHIKRPGGSDYAMPQSQVQPISVTPDDAERPNQSNLVNAYDVAAHGYSGISSGASGTTDTRSAQFDAELEDAIGKLDDLDDEIPGGFSTLKQRVDAKFSSDRSGISDRSGMSVLEALKADKADIESSWNSAMSSVQSNDLNPMQTRIGKKIDDMTENVRKNLL